MTNSNLLFILQLDNTVL